MTHYKKINIWVYHIYIPNHTKIGFNSFFYNTNNRNNNLMCFVHHIYKRNKTKIWFYKLTSLLTLFFYNTNNNLICFVHHIYKPNSTKIPFSKLPSITSSFIIQTTQNTIYLYVIIISGISGTTIKAMKLLVSLIYHIQYFNIHCLLKILIYIYYIYNCRGGRVRVGWGEAFLIFFTYLSIIIDIINSTYLSLHRYIDRKHFKRASPHPARTLPPLQSYIIYIYISMFTRQWIRKYWMWYTNENKSFITMIVLPLIWCTKHINYCLCCLYYKRRML